jgi:hypothetical protein
MFVTHTVVASIYIAVLLQVCGSSGEPLGTNALTFFCSKNSINWLEGFLGKGQEKSFLIEVSDQLTYSFF